jgi:hypothetical protein
VRQKIAFATLIIPLLAAAAGCASAEPLTNQQTDLVSAACTQIMGLRPGETYYADCKESLGNSLATKISSTQTVRGMDDCSRRGLAEGSPAFSACVLEQQDSEPVRNAVAQPVVLTYPRDELKSGKSYYNVSNEVHWKREQYSCAQLGLTPGTNGFQHCVVSLDAALLPDD